MNNNGLLKALLAGLLIMYVVSPLDLAPGPIDDILLILFNIAMSSRRQSSDRILPSGSADDVRQE